MSKPKKSTIEVQGAVITIMAKQYGDYISLTDMVRNFDGGSALIEQWLKNKDTVLFLGVWEKIHNPDFNSLEFEGIKNEAGRNSFFLSAKKWIKLAGAKGLIASAGRYGGTYAHQDIAFEFGSWLSPEFKLYLIRSFSGSRMTKTAVSPWHGISIAPSPSSTTASTPTPSRPTSFRPRSHPLRPRLPTRPKPMFSMLLCLARRPGNGARPIPNWMATCVTTPPSSSFWC